MVSFSFKLMPENTEDHANYLLKIGLVDECANKYLFMLNNDDFQSKYGKSKHQVNRKRLVLNFQTIN